MPNKALLENQNKKAKGIGLNMALWTAKNYRTLPETQLIFVALKSAVFRPFQECTFY